MICRTFVLSLILGSLALAQQAPNPEADQALKRLRPPKGLQASLFSAEPDFVNPVAFAFDEKGRAYVVETHRLGNCTYDIRGHMAWVDDDLACRTVADRDAMHRKYMGAKYDKLVDSERVRFLEDRDGDGRVDHAVTFAEGFGTPATGLAAGVLARGDDVWFACIPDLWKFKNIDGKAEQKTALHTGFGVRLAFIGHDLHGLRFGPDGKLYFTIGDRGVHVEKDGKVLVDNPDSGCVMRCNADGSGLEVFATGLRNPQELAFDAYGNLWTGDNNCDAGDAARWTYIMEGGDCGWRIGYQQAPGRGPWMAEKLWQMDAWKTAPSQVPPVAHVGHGPSGICFNGGIGLPEAYKDHFFFTDFPGSVLSFAVKPKGAGFEVTDLKTFVGDVWPTDVEIGNDGALYFSDWVNGWGMPNKGRIYRISDPALAASAAVLEAKKILAEGMGKYGDDEVAALMAHGDQRIRLAAQFELADRKNPAALKSALDAARPQIARIHAIWGLSQRGEAGAVAALLSDADPEIRAQAAKVVGERKYSAALDGLLPLLKDPSARTRSFAAMALGKLGRKEAVGPLFEMLRENADQDAWLRHAGVIALAWINDGGSLTKMRTDASVSVRLAALLALRRLNRPEVSAFLEDQDPAIVFEAVRAINDAPIPSATNFLAEMLDKKLPEKAWPRAINAAYRIGDVSALVRFVARKDVPDAARAEALKALSEWAHPSGRDRIQHVWRALPDRESTAAREGLTPAIDGLLQDGPDPVKEAAATAAGALEIKSAAPRIAELTGKGRSVWVRIAALKALGALKDERLPAAVMAAVEDKDANLRKEATKLLSQLKVPNIVALLEKLATEEGPVAVRQNAVESLGRMSGADAEKALGRLVDALQGGTVPKSLRLDILEAAAQKASLKEKVAGMKTVSKEDPMASYRDALEGGDLESGRKIFYEKAEASCAKCHKAYGRGGEVGPNLDGIAMQKTREYLLESIVLPNKEIAQGFAQSVFQMQSDAIETGRVEKENDKEVVIILSDGNRKTLAKTDIKARKVGLSAMPEDEVQRLTRRELRDVIEFLASLKER